MMLGFKEWLTDQQYREDFVGDLARALHKQDVAHKSSRRKTDEHRNWADIVIRSPEPGHIAAFNEAWQEFLLAKQAAKESADPQSRH